MSYQAPDGWRLPARTPQHATAPGGSGIGSGIGGRGRGRDGGGECAGRGTPLRVHAHRALRLAATAGAWAAGLCLVVGLIALVAGTASPAGTTHVSPAAGIRRLPPGRLPGSDTGHRAGGGGAWPTRTFRGAGSATTGPFTVTPRSRYQLRWSYSCPAGLTRGHLLIRESGTAGVSVTAAGAAGSGSTWAWAPSAAHYLVVVANCAWVIQVTGAR
jgi:hypothetical protein